MQAVSVFVLYLLHCIVRDESGWALAQVISLQPFTQMPGFEPRLFYLGFVMFRGVMGQDSV
jgi:hypothetical protein